MYISHKFDKIRDLSGLQTHRLESGPFTLPAEDTCKTWQYAILFIKETTASP